MNQAIDQSQLPIASEPVAVPRGTLKSIQMLRGLAASVVIVGHLCRAVHDYGLTAGSVARFRGFAEFGASGVDVFFVISGFIMIVTTERTKPLQRSSVTFLKKRALRIYPLYWCFLSILVLLFVHAKLSHPGTIQAAGTSPTFILKSYFLFPALNHITGEIQPLLVPGWTLSYEMFFYLFFACVIGMDLFKSALIQSAAFVCLFLVGLVTHSSSVVLKFAVNPITFEFCFGMFAGLLYLRAKPMKARWALLLGALALAGFGVTVVIPFDHQYRTIVWGLPALALVIALTQIERKGLSVSALALLLGDASYSIYLSHQLIVAFLFERCLKSSWVVRHVSINLLIAFGVAFCLAAGVCCYWVVELPMTRRLSGNRRKAGVSGTPEQLAASVKNEGDQVLVKIIEIATADPDPECDPSMSM